MAREQGRTAQGTVGQRGFTLVELLIVIVVLAILVGIAYPSYQNYVTKSRRADAKSMLSQVASRQEQYFLNNKSYTSGLAAVWSPDTSDADGDGVTNEFVSEAGYYALGVAAGPTADIATSYALTATPQLAQARDTQCQSFTLDSRGERGLAGSPTGTAADCW